MHRIFLLALIFAVFFISSAPQMALSAEKGSTQAPPYKVAADVPAFLLEKIRARNTPIFMEEYLGEVMRPFRQYSQDKRNLSKADVDRMQDDGLQQIRRQKFQQMLSFDHNFDGQVTRDEAVASIEKNLESQRNSDNFQQMLDREIGNIMSADENGDGVVSTKEMSILGEKEKEAVARQSSNSRRSPQVLLDLDPDKDGILKDAELEILARSAFSFFDRDKDGHLSVAELVEVEKQKNNMPRSDNPRNKSVQSCNLPKPGPDEKVMFIGVTDPQSVSNVALHDQNHATYAVSIEVADDIPDKANLILSAPFKTIWRITGEGAKKLSRVMVLGPEAKSQNEDVSDVNELPVSAGVIGVAENKIYFGNPKEGCATGSYAPPIPVRGIPKDFQEQFKQTFGRMPDFFFGKNRLQGARIAKDGITEVAPKEPTGYQEGFDRQTWEYAVGDFSGGVIDLKEEKIITRVKSEPYGVLPSWFGISQLISEGVLVQRTQKPIFSARLEAKNGEIVEMKDLDRVIVYDDDREIIYRSPEFLAVFDVIKTTSRIPADLRGAIRVHFYLQKGVEPPTERGGIGGAVCLMEHDGTVISGFAHKGRCH